MNDQKIRVLCLHGLGSNSKVYEAQTAALRHELGDDFEWIFVEGTISVPMDSALKGYYPEDSEYFSYINVDDPDFAEPLTHLERYILLEGPFDIVMAACSTAALSAALLLHKADEGAMTQLFKGAVFLSGGRPFDHSVLNSQGLKFLENDTGHAQLAIPTANIWGIKDARSTVNAPQLAALCSLKENFNFIHDSDSSIPQAKDQDDLIGAAQAIRRTVDLALFAH